jgi:hypothetical protein
MIPCSVVTDETWLSGGRRGGWEVNQRRIDVSNTRRIDRLLIFVNYGYLVRNPCVLETQERCKTDAETAATVASIVSE